SGFDQYEKLYADAKLWLNQGWIDYFTPQLYWKINKIPQSYPVLLGWWENENTQHRHLWPGINISSKDVDANIDETINQIMVTRGIVAETPGTVLWSIGPLVRQPELIRAIAEGPYARPALVPPSPWLDAIPPSPPIAAIDVKGDSLILRWTHPNPDDIFRWVVYYQYGSSRTYQILNHGENDIRLPLFIPKPGKKMPTTAISDVDLNDYVSRLNGIRVSAVDRMGNESELTPVPIKDLAKSITPDRDLLTMTQPKSKKATPPARVKLGIEVLITEQLDLIRGKRVGLITNPSAVGPDLRSDIDILANTPGVNLTALFGAEHGVRGARHGKIIQEG
ncbi:DUF1343 domain-containing protein, partial [bacterium]|nr:DUF1343 domain-containing protein [bacterium]